MRRRVGVLGGGQLGMMLAGSLFKLGADVFLYDPDPRSPAKRRYANVMTGGFRDEEALSRFVAQCDVLTYEFENVEADGLRAVVGDVPIFPSLDVLQTTQHRAEEKRFCQRAGLPHARFAIAGSADELRAAGRGFGYPHLVKVARGGYDGKGQHRVTDEASLDRVATELSAAFDGGFGVVLEELVPFVLEASCIVARSDTGEEVVFPVFENQHEHHVLDVTVVPARVPADVAAALGDLALRAARELGVIGLLTTEFFVARAADVPATSTTGLRVGEHVVYVNEFAPRPHNSGHVTRSACNFSQFDAHARVLVGMPIGKPRLMAEGYYAMGNLLGDLWVKRGGELDFAQWARHPEVVDILLYGKHDARPGRKMGHFVAHGSTADAVITAAKAFRRDLVGGLRARSASLRDGELPARGRLPHAAGRLPHAAGRLPHAAGRLARDAKLLVHAAAHLPPTAEPLARDAELLVHAAAHLPPTARRLAHSALRMPHAASKAGTCVAQTPPNVAQTPPDVARMPHESPRSPPFASRLPHHVLRCLRCETLREHRARRPQRPRSPRTPKRPMAQQTHRGVAIRAARRAAGLTVVELATRSGVSRATLTRWEAGRVGIQGGKGLRSVVAVIRSADAEQGRVLGQALGLVPRAARLVDPAAAPSVLELALFRVADAIDVPAGRLRWAVEEMARATREAGGTLDDLERACRDGAAKGKARPPSAGG